MNITLCPKAYVFLLKHKKKSYRRQTLRIEYRFNEAGYPFIHHFLLIEDQVTGANRSRKEPYVCFFLATSSSLLGDPKAFTDQDLVLLVMIHIAWPQGKARNIDKQVNWGLCLLAHTEVYCKVHISARKIQITLILHCCMKREKKKLFSYFINDTKLFFMYVFYFWDHISANSCILVCSYDLQ